MTSTSIQPAEVAVALEERGFESFWAGDHSHIPVEAGGTGVPIDTRTGYPMPNHYWQLLDPFLVLTAAAQATTTIKLGAGICLVNERHPITTAKQVATLDHLSGGRFVFGIGGGWNEHEMRNHGVEIRDRWDAMRERIEAMTAIWTQDVAEYHGDHVEFGPMMSWPKPVQRPRPPVLIGGNVRNMARVLDYADGWCPGTPQLTDDELRGQLAEFARLADDVGRGVTVTAFHVTTGDGLALGSDDLLNTCRWDVLADAGVERVVVVLPPERDACLALADHYAAELLARVG
ncbi:MAG TPA: LLM class F420-dependent oxidoreductase [Jatrophihabitantaceae bacterium]